MCCRLWAALHSMYWPSEVVCPNILKEGNYYSWSCCFKVNGKEKVTERNETESWKTSNREGGV